MKKQTLIMAIAATITFSALTNFADAGDGDRKRLRARLANVGANATAQSKADWEIRADGRMKLDVEGRNMSPDFSSVDVYLNGSYLASATVFAGSFDVDIDTNDGDNVPTVNSGDLVEVYDSDSSDLLFTGEFSDRRGGQGGGGGGGGGTEVELFVQMTNIGANSLASAHSRHRTIGSRLTFDVEGEDLSGDFTSVDIFAAGKYIGTESVDQFGRFSLDIDTSEGDSNVPALSEGDVVEVFNTTDGSIMFAGSLQISK